jgi:hypothetical protein
MLPTLSLNGVQHDQTVSAVATRYDKLATNYLSSIQLASTRLWLHVNVSTP